VTLSPNQTSYTDSNVTAYSTYRYRVSAVDTSSNSATSNMKLATTASFSDDPLLAGSDVRAVHITELRTAVNALRAFANMSSASWTDTSLVGVAIKAVHIQELRTKLIEALTAVGLTPPTFSDEPLTQGISVIRRNHIDELRGALR
jgi:hypothetical protein